ncbi:hypothetical protein FOZ63_031513 [Perkinsus olseni]|uniref:Uncharacterized protein n=1 Tax=Perkinsus olseni TaxID=32597 RepID=A0A7J6Q411_PEROL|nr:hypothetical protein FOZ63_031513 [Perkinsus olseni]
MPMHAALDGPRPDGNVEPQIHPDLRECAYCSNYRLAEGGPPPSDLSTSPSIEERSRLAALIDDKFLILHGENGVYCEVKDTEWDKSTGSIGPPPLAYTPQGYLVCQDQLENISSTMMI